MWIIADAHAGADPRGDADLLELLGEAEARREDLLILGDLFAAWLGDARFHSPLQARALATIAGLRAAGGRAIFVTGNRDYFVEAERGRAFDEVLEESVIPIGGVPTLVTHGDRLNTRDLGYRAWRQLSRGPWSRALAGALPGPAVRTIAARLERALATTNRAYKTGALPIEALEALGRRAATLGAARALVGHFHHDRTLEVEGGVPVVLAPAWLDHRRILVVDPGGALRSVAPLTRPGVESG